LTATSQRAQSGAIAESSARSYACSAAAATATTV
jgi:hypothetical protein